MAIKVNKDEIPKTVIEAKRWWRREIRRALSETDEAYRPSATASIALNTLCLKELDKAETVFAYFSVGKEVGTLALISKLLEKGKRVCLPLCTDIDKDGNKVSASPDMEARLIRGAEDLVPGAYNIPEPAPDTEIVQPGDIDMVILPCVGCDKSCRRIGHGRGYYDKFLESLRDDCFKAALCYDAVLADELPVEEHDQPVDAVITEDAVYRWRR